MGQYRLRNDVPINLSGSYKEESLHIRNKLLLFRFRNLNKRKPAEALVDRSIEPRLNQIFVPLLSIIEDPETCMMDVELYRECSLRVHWLKSISRWIKEALRWEAKLLFLVTTTCLPDSMWTRRVSRSPLPIIRDF
jgi:hypothetical protein